MAENPSSDDRIEEVIKIHQGKPVMIQYVGGEHHGERVRLRRPLKKSNEVAKPTRYLGNNFYDATTDIGYETYVLMDFNGELYYVVREWLEDFPDCINREHEPTNHRLIREERERGGPKDLVESGTQKEKEFLSQNVVGRCNKCLRATFNSNDIGNKCGAIKPNLKKCDGTFVLIADMSPTRSVVKAVPTETRLTEQDKMQADFEEFGIAFLVDGKRVHPAKVRMMVRTKNPLTISIKDLIDQ